MAQLVFGAALGFLIGQCALLVMRRFAGWLHLAEVARRIGPLRGSSVTAAVTKYSGVIGTVAIVVVLGVWSVREYLAASSASGAPITSASDPAAIPTSDPQDSGDEIVPVASSTRSADRLDPYADPQFKVLRQPHHPGTRASLKEALVQRSEAKARADLLKETHEHMRRSQYDCETAERASRYLKAGLDVWGFASWQVKYFPVNGYKGATLERCKDIKDVLDPSKVALQATAATENDG